MYTILIVDDDHSFRSMLRTALETEGYAVDEAGTGKEGLSMFFRFKHHLIITDIVMPEMDGVEMVRTIRKELAETKIIAMSGADEVGTLGLEAAQVLGADYILFKPFKTNDIVKIIDRELRPCCKLTE